MSNFFNQIAQAATRFPGRPAIEMLRSSGMETMTYSGLVDRAARTSAWLSSVAGAQAGDRAAIFAANTPEWVAAYLGILHAGCVAVPLDTAYSPAQVHTVIADSGARVLFVSERLEAVARSALSGIPHATHVVRLDADLPVTDERSVTARQPDDAAAILYTSGTTADPKGVVLTHGNLDAERTSALAVIHVTEEDVVLGVLPLFHALAQMANLLLPLSAGARVVFLETVNSTTLLAALESREVTIFACVPQFFYLIHQRVMSEVGKRGGVARTLFRAAAALTTWLRNTTGINPGPMLFARVHHVFGPRMRMLITGGSRFDPAIARDLYGVGLVLLNGYGLTETSGAATVMRPDDRFTTSVGHPLPGVEIRIEPDTTLADDPAEPGSGEILIRGAIVMREYFARPEATAEALVQGWLRTGDLGRFDSDGRLYITGRRKDVIVLASGKNLYPEEIEAHYRQSPFIKELCVLGATTMDAPASERLHAIVVPDDDAMRARGVVNQGELIRFEIENLSVRQPAHKRILTYELATEPLPRTTTGKLRRGDIARLVSTRTSSPESARTTTPADDAWMDVGRRRAWINAVAHRLGRAVVHPDDNLELDLHLDSMERVELLSMLEQQAGTQVAPEARAVMFTVRQVVEAVEAATPSGRSEPDTADRDEWTVLLQAPPDSNLVRDLDRPAGVRAAVFFVCLKCALTVLRVFARIEVRGREHLPAAGPFLLVPNHQTYLDAFVITAGLPFHVLRNIFFVGATEYFETPLTRRLARAANIVPVDPDANLVSAMRAAAGGLERRKILMLFPEGERTIDGTRKPFRKGAAILASHLDVPVVPIALDGLFELWPRGRSFNWRRLVSLRSRITVSIAPPLTLSGTEYGELTRRLEQAVDHARLSRT